MEKYYYKRLKENGDIHHLLTYDQIKPNEDSPLLVEITAEEYDNLVEELHKKDELICKLYAEEISINNVPEEWRDEIQTCVNEIIISQGTHDVQEIAENQALDIILGGEGV